PSLALHPDIDIGPVVSPYSSALALMVSPQAALANLQRLNGLGLVGPMGFYESIDYSRESRGGTPGVVIYAYMSHHQGMSFLAIANTVHGAIMQRRFHASPLVRAVETLLFE